jgi:PTH1 family peptidyl-tRNA hydrolase
VKLVVGLGNPGKQYELTRHNVGWWVIDHLADVWHFESWRKDRDALVSDGRFGNVRVRLMKPQTFMNLSGNAVAPYLRRDNWTPASNLLVIVDEVALPLGSHRFRASGSAGGHNGLKSIEAHVGTQDYARLRIGIRPAADQPIGDLSAFVLGKAGKAEREAIRAQFGALEEVVRRWLV